MRMWDLISPPKILGAVCRNQRSRWMTGALERSHCRAYCAVITCSVNSMTRGSWLDLTKFRRFSLVTSPSNVLRPSSNCNTPNIWTQILQPHTTTYLCCLPPSTTGIYQYDTANQRASGEPDGFFYSVQNRRECTSVPPGPSWQSISKNF